MALPERLVFSPSVEGLLVRGLGGQLTPEVREELRRIGIDLDRALLPAYPAQTWHRALELVARRVYPELSLARAYFRMGERTVYGLDDTLLGKAMLAMARLVGPRRMLLRLPISVKTGSNFAHLEAKELAPNEMQLTSQPYMGLAEFMQGSVQAAIELSGGAGATVEVLEYNRDQERLVLRARWKA